MAGKSGITTFPPSINGKMRGILYPLHYTIIYFDFAISVNKLATSILGYTALKAIPAIF